MNLKQATLALGVAGIAATATIANAEPGLNYNYFELDYVNLDIDGYDDSENIIEDFDDGNGFAVRGQGMLTEHVFLFGDYSETDADASFRDSNNAAITEEQDVKRFNIGLGLRNPVSADTDFVGRLAYTDIDYGDFDFGGSSDPRLSDLDDDPSDGFFIDGRLRKQLAPNWEGSAGLRYTDIERADNVSFVGNLLYEIDQNWGVNFEVDAGDEIGFYSLGLRYSL